MFGPKCVEVKQSVSLCLLVLFALLPLVYDFFSGDSMHLDGSTIGFASYRTLSIVFFYLMGWFIDSERRKEEENRRLMKELQDSESRLRDYADRIAGTVALEERTRLARDIHDSLGHSLTAMKIQLSKAEAYHSVDPDESLSAVTAARESADDAIKDVRESLKKLNGDESTISLKKDLTRLVDRLEDTGMEVDFHMSGSDEGYNYSVQIGLFRLIQEGITNILRHADAKKVSLSVNLEAQAARVVLEDDGKGFNVESLQTDENLAEHYGLRGLNRRMEIVRGVLKIESAPGEGTRLIAEAPADPLKLLGEEQ